MSINNALWNGTLRRIDFPSSEYIDLLFTFKFGAFLHDFMNSLNLSAKKEGRRKQTKKSSASQAVRLTVSCTATSEGHDVIEDLVRAKGSPAADPVFAVAPVLFSSVAMGRIYLEHIGGRRLFSCAQCDTFLTNRSELISTRFTGATGRAFLFNRVVNLNYSDVQDRVMLTGRHMVRDVFCKNCDSKLGWMYEYATDESQRYKESRVILERALVVEADGIDENSRPARVRQQQNQQQQQQHQQHQQAAAAALAAAQVPLAAVLGAAPGLAAAAAQQAAHLAPAAPPHQQPNP